MTKCGHSFCYGCLVRSLESDSRCPKCCFIVEKKEEIFPNFLLAELVAKHKEKRKDLSKLNDIAGDLDLEKLDACRLDQLLLLLSQKKMTMVQKRTQANNDILKSFLKKAFDKKTRELNELNGQLGHLKEDLDKIECTKKMDGRKEVSQTTELMAVVPASSSALPPTPSHSGKINKSHQDTTNLPTPTPADEEFNTWKGLESSLSSSIASQRKKVDQHFEELLELYLDGKKREVGVDGSGDGISGSSNSSGSSSSSSISGSGGGKVVDKGLTAEDTSTESSAKTDDISQSMFQSTSTSVPSLSNHPTPPPSSNHPTPPSSSNHPTPPSSSSSSSSSLACFSESLNKFTKFSSLRVLSSFNYHTDICNAISIVSSIEFDKDLEYFAIAGVTKKIKIFEYASVTKDQVDVHYPVCDMICSSKLSSVVWNSYHKNLLASSNYDGMVCLWDVCVASKIRMFQEHEKRCWTVDFNKLDPCLLASGSDDSTVRVWHTNSNHSVACLKIKANICGVKFNPESLSHLAFGSADHCIHYYDLRYSKQPLIVLKGHKKAVSYAKFINRRQLVSASTDSQLKLWDVVEGTCLKTYQGHCNERNFVGLAADNDYIACGSENNSIYVYCKDLSQPMLSYKFEALHSVLQTDKVLDEERKDFVGAVCWKAGSNVVLAANSQGNVKVLEMV